MFNIPNIFHQENDGDLPNGFLNIDRINEYLRLKVGAESRGRR